MANPWFRLYSELATDPKIQMMSESDQRRYIMLLCLRCSNGDVTLHDEEVAFQLRISNDEWLRSKALFQSKDLIDDDNKPIAWDKRQYESDSSTGRVAKYREKKKQACNVSVTPPDTESDTDTEKTKPSAQIQRLDCSPELFEEFWTNYPRRPGSSKADSLKAWKARIKDGADPLIIVEAAAKYATYCQATATEPQFIKQPATFLGPGKHYESNWTPPPRASPRMSHNDASKLSAARTIFGTEVEGTANATGRIIDITPTAAGSLGSEDFPRDAGQLRLAVPEPVENWAGR